MGFPAGFLWGAATAAYQIEGAVAEDGRSPSIWDMFCARPGTVWNGDSAAVACDHYHRYEEDVGLMRDLGLGAYRFSIAWPRVLPEGVGRVNRAGLDFYSRLVDALLAAGITPFVTLYHWDLPQVLQDRGGWVNRASADWFGEYAGAVVDALSDRVQHWITINEIQVIVQMGSVDCFHAPGVRLPRRDVLQAGHNLLRAHGAAVQAIRAGARTRPQVGFAPVGVTGLPQADTEADRAAAAAYTYGTFADTLMSNVWWLDPIFRGAYPAAGLALYGGDAPAVAAGDMALIHQPLDFLGLNIYFGQPVCAGDSAGYRVVPPPAGSAYSPMGFLVSPTALYWGPKLLAARYGVPLYITENGLGWRDWVHQDGSVHDPARIDYLARHLGQLQRAIATGVDVRGYFYWSLMDNFEWGLGYRERFGLYYVDFVTQRRLAKDSAAWYRAVIADNGRALAEAAGSRGEPDGAW